MGCSKRHMSANLNFAMNSLRNQLKCPCQSGCPTGCPCDDYECYGMEANSCDEIQCNNDGVCQDGECDCAQTGKTDIWLPKSI